MILPENGRIVVVDDKWDEVKGTYFLFYLKKVILLFILMVTTVHFLTTQLKM
jgi:hypothetical protein